MRVIIKVDFNLGSDLGGQSTTQLIGSYPNRPGTFLFSFSFTPKNLANFYILRAPI